MISHCSINIGLSNGYKNGYLECKIKHICMASEKVCKSRRETPYLSFKDTTQWDITVFETSSKDDKKVTFKSFTFEGNGAVNSK